MAEGFDNVNAPQFFDFNKDLGDLDDTADEYFVQVHEDPLNNSDFSNGTTMLVDELEEMQISEGKDLRRSMSHGDLQTVLGNIHRLRNGKQYAYENCQNGNHSVTKNSTQSLNYEAALCSNGSQEFINRLAQPKRNFKSAQDLNSNNYVSMAEALNKFQNGTPTRFKTRPKAVRNENLRTTIAHSPKLKTAARSRPLHVQSREELEQLALAEAEKFKFKARPVNKNILQGPVNSHKPEKRVSTIPQPFKLTAVHSKTVPESHQKVQEFHARPVPKFVYEYRQPVKPPMKAPLTVPKTPTFIKKSNCSASNIVQNQSAVVEPTKLKPTKPIPFSFELRDKCMKSKREALIKKYIETEKKAREFHAKPIPKSVIDPSNKTNSNSSLNSRINSQESMNSCQFKAKPPKVLYQAPFAPLLPNRPLLEIPDFTLNTDLRAKERENFEHQLKIKEEKLALLKQKEEIMKKRQEEEEIIKARNLAKFKAQEIRKYKEIKIQPVKKVTNPVSPKFTLNRLRKNSVNKENDF